MESVTKVVSIAASVIITMILVALGSYEAGVASSSVKTSVDSMAEESREWIEADFEDLDGSQVTGERLISLARKYRDDYVIAVDTTGDSVANVSWRDGQGINNDISNGEAWVDPTAIFQCAVSYGTAQAGNIDATFNSQSGTMNSATGLCFKIISDSSAINTYTTSSAADYVTNKTSHDFADLDEVVKYIRQTESSGDLSAIEELKLALGASNEDLSVDGLIKLATETIKDQNTKLASHTGFSETNDTLVIDLPAGESYIHALNFATTNYIATVWDGSNWFIKENDGSWMNTDGADTGNVDSKVNISTNENNISITNTGSRAAKVSIIFK